MDLFSKNTNRIKFLLAVLLITLTALLVKIYIPSHASLDIYKEYLKSLNNYTARVLVAHNNGLDEQETIEHLKSSAKALNIDLKIVNANEDLDSKRTRYKIYSIIKNYKPDFILTLDDRLYPYNLAPNYLILNRDGLDRYLIRKSDGRVELAMKELYKFDALLLSFPGLDLVKSAYESRGPKFFGLEWHPEMGMQKLLTMHKEHVAYAKFYAQIQPSNKINIEKLPPKLKGIVKNGELPKNCALLMVNSGKYEYFLSTTSIDWEKIKLITIMKTLDKARSKFKPIPNGGYLISYEDGVHNAYAWPVIAFASDRELVAKQKVVLIPDNECLDGYNDLFQNIEQAIRKHPWHSKTAKIFWRGQTTGHYFHTDTKKSFPRLEMLRKTAHQDFIDAAFSHFTLDISRQDKKYIEKNFPLKDFVPIAESLNYKYLLDVDGHSCSYSRMAWILYSNSMLMKHSSQKIQWYYDKLQPFVHYIPISEDFSDIAQQYAWAENHPNEVQDIIGNARKLAAQTFAAENIISATIDGFNRYSKIIKDPAHQN